MNTREWSPDRVDITLSQHIGSPAVPVVSVGDQVTAGQKIGAIPEGKLGAAIHASIAGQVVSIDATRIRIQR
jgi:Na+-translocating ferredoxin:NAD+ oxidoreductase RnfC subunit